MIRIFQFYMIAIAFSFTLERRLFNRVRLFSLSSFLLAVACRIQWRIFPASLALGIALHNAHYPVVAVALTPVAAVFIYYYFSRCVCVSVPFAFFSSSFCFSFYFIAENLWPFSVSIFNTERANVKEEETVHLFSSTKDDEDASRCQCYFVVVAVVATFLLIFHFNLYNYFIYITSFKPNEKTYYSPLTSP